MMPHDSLSHVATSFSSHRSSPSSNSSTKRRLALEDDPTVLPPALSSYSIQCLNERTKTSTLPSQITGKYELDFPDSNNKRDNTLRNKLAAHFTNESTRSREISNSFTNLSEDRSSINTAPTTTPGSKTFEDLRSKRKRRFGKSLGPPKRGIDIAQESTPVGDKSSSENESKSNLTPQLKPLNEIKPKAPSLERFSPLLKRNHKSIETDDTITKRIEARRREQMEQEFVKKEKENELAEMEIKKLEQVAVLQSPFEELKFNEFQEPKQSRVPLREIPVNSADVFRKPKAPKSVVSPSPNVQSNPIIPPTKPVFRNTSQDFPQPPQQLQHNQKHQQALPSAPIPPKVHYDRPQHSGNKRALIINGKSYEKLELIGKGGSSKVYRVRSLNNNCVYALKKVELGQFEDVSGFKGEIDLLTKLKSCERVVTLVDYATTESSLYLIMEKGDLDLAEVLQYRLKLDAPLDLNFVKYHTIEIFKCIKDVHDAGIVHSDLKPANFLFVRGMLKIIDFGIANAVPDHTINVYRENQIGTPNYMAPEAICESNYTSARIWKVGKPSDIWSIGCILYQFIYGKAPFAGYSGNQKLMAITNPHIKISFPSSGIGNTPVPLSAIELMKNCLHRDPNDRWTIEQCLACDFLSPKIVSENFIREVVHQSINYGYNSRISGDGMTSDRYDALVDSVMKQIQNLNYS
ncbi:serine/threonine-protein kinase, putative [Candida dubliniensis CD36]|uniref:Serine/threonine-protein kinase, putative n=1 Tax=Candida dubliniensis (strain CD36 / ATCC MYA-646 / CBS 7987 / NCPF 3949 / NRRL Y-17841) TaxID=573826 RepID=B9WMR8_CANDC|nr:serine/threonine-protein kinase, putative [Candida dubliniensis CD36]CAX40384.1 serine/threonine-protein kinase, putative [Candida dubliniensis CD36]